MANFRSFTGFLTLDLLGANAISVGSTFTVPGSDPLDIIIQDGDAQLQGDVVTDEQSSDPQADQFAFVTNSDGEALVDGAEVYVESSFTFTLDGAGSFTGYVLEPEGSGQSFIVLPPNITSGTIEITTINSAANNIAYTDLGSGDEVIDQNDFANLDLSAADTISSGAGNDVIDAGEGDDSVLAGAGDDTVFGNAGDDTVDGGAGNDSIRGDSGEDGVTAVRESFNWAQLGLSSGQTVPNNANGIDQDTGNITVNLDYVELARFSDFEYRNNFEQNTDGIDTGGETIGNDIGFLVGDSSSPPGDTMEVEFNFSANTAGFEDEVRNVQFRINDLDDSNWRDVIEIHAFDADGNAVPVVLTGGNRITLTDTDGVNGFDTATANDVNQNNNPIDAATSLLVEIPGPVASFTIRYGNLETGGQRVDITDIFFDAVPTAVANVETGDDSLLGGAGDDTIFGEAGEDTIEGGLDNDSVDGGANDDLLVIDDNFGDDTIVGGEIGETTGDTLDGGVLTQSVNVQYTGDEAATFTNNAGSDGQFSQIEHINTGSGDDTIDGTLDTVGIDLDAGAGADTILGGQAGDTLNAGSGADTIDGQAGDDAINAGDGDDEIRLSAGFDNDSIIGGEGGETTGDTVSGATLTEDVVVTFDGDESGNFVGQTSGDNAAFDEIEGVTTGSGDDTVDASADSTGQIIATNAGSDSILGGSGGDTINAGGNSDTVDGGAGADSILGGGGSDNILGGAGADTINAGTGGDTIDGGEGADSINASNGFDLINLTGNFGDDTIVGGEAGNDGDTLSGSTLTEAIDVTFSGDEAGNFTGQTTGSDATFSEIEVINTGSGDDTIDASADSAGTTINTGAGADTVLGGAGGDTLTTGTGDDTVDGGAGADSINAGDGDDELRLNDGFGNDTIIAGEGGETTGDTLAGGGLTEDVTVTFANDEDGAVTNGGGDNASFEEVERVETGSGADIIDATASTGGVDVDSGEGDDTVTGGTGADTLAAAGGADVINGGAGADSIDAGDGDDLINLTGNFGDDSITGGEGGETTGDTLAGSTLTEAINVTFTGDEAGNFTGQTTGSDASFVEIEAIETGSGDDTVDASADTQGVNVRSNGGDDTILGGTGGDTLAGGEGADTVDGGLGADSVTGGGGDDELRINDLFGDDTIVGGETGETTGDTLAGGGLTENITITFNSDGESGTVTNPGGDSAQFSEIEAFTFGSGDDTIDASATTGGMNLDGAGGSDSILGGSGQDTLIGSGGSDTIDGGAGDDVLEGGDGADVFVMRDGFGSDTIIGGDGGNNDLGSLIADDVDPAVNPNPPAPGDPVEAPTGNFDTIDFSAVSTAVNASFNASSTGTSNAGANSIFFQGIESIVLSGSGDTVDASSSNVGILVDGGAGADSLVGGAGGDSLIGGEGGDVLIGGAGGDFLDGGAGDDSLFGGGGEDVVFGGLGNDFIIATPGEDAVYGGAGNDDISVGAADDTVQGGADNDTIDAGSEDDLIFGGDGADSIFGGDPITAPGGTNAVGLSWTAIELGTFNDVDPNEGNVDSENAADLIGSYGSLDDPLYEQFVTVDAVDPNGDGAIEDNDSGGTPDTIQIDGNDAQLDSTQGYNATITFTDGTTATFSAVVFQTIDGRVFLAPETSDNADNTVLTSQPIASISLDSIIFTNSDLTANRIDASYQVDGDGGDDTLYGNDGADTIDGLGGNDSIAGGAGDDSLEGGDGADTIEGDAGIDLVRESFNWSEIPDPSGDGTAIDDADIISGGTVQDTGGVSVTMSWTDDGIGESLQYRTTTQLVDGIDGGTETVSTTSSAQFRGTGNGDNSTTTLTFASNDPTVLDEVLNVQFRVNDIDEGAFRDSVTIRAFDAAGNPLEVQLTGGSEILRSDVDGLSGFDSGTVADGTGGAATTDVTNSVLVNIAGPVGRIEIDYDNLENGFQAIWVTDVFFDTQVVNTAGGDDSISGGAGDDVLLGQSGNDTIDGGEGNDSIEGDGVVQAPPVSTRITEANFTDTTSGYTVTAQNIEGGVLTAPDVANVGILNGTLGANGVVSDTDSGQNGQLAYDLASGQSETLIVDIDSPVEEATFDFSFLFTDTFGEVGHYAVFLDGVLVSEADFTEDAVGSGSGTVQISGVGEFDQIVFTALPQTDGTDGSDYGVTNITFPVPGDILVSDPPGDDSILGGAGEDTILGQEGSDTIDGGLDADLINAGDDQDTIVLTDNFGADTIAGGEGGTDGDTLDQSALSAPVNVQYTGDEAGTTTDGTSTATFSEIETQILTDFNDTLDATLDTVGTNVFAGAGDDTLLGGSGGDTLRGEAGSDTIDGAAGADSIVGGDGDDELRINDGFGDDTIVGGEGGETNGDTLAGGGLTEDVTVTINADGESGTVTNPGGDSANFAEIEAVETGSGDDTVDASASTVGVNVTTNEGEDVITGGAGDDSIDAGADDDTITFGQNDTVLGGAGADEFIIQPSTDGMSIIGDFDPSTNVDNTVMYDSTNPPVQTDNDLVDLSGFFANLKELYAANTPNGDGDVVLDLGDGQTLTLVGVTDVRLLNFENTNVICFTRGALIRTPKGDVAVEDLREGDLVETMDSGAQPIRWIGRRAISAGMIEATPRLRPVKIAKGALGNSRDLMVSPQHRMLLSGERAEMLFGVDEVLASAKDLVDGDTIFGGPTDDVEYFHILFDDHEIIFVEDAPTESFHPGRQALSTTTQRAQAEILELFPELVEECHDRPAARMILKAHEARALVR